MFPAPTRPRSPRDDTPITLYGNKIAPEQLDQIINSPFSSNDVKGGGRAASPVFSAPPPQHVFEFLPNTETLSHPLEPLTSLPNPPRDIPVMAGLAPVTSYQPPPLQPQPPQLAYQPPQAEYQPAYQPPQPAYQPPPVQPAYQPPPVQPAYQPPPVQPAYQPPPQQIPQDEPPGLTSDPNDAPPPLTNNAQFDPSNYGADFIEHYSRYPQYRLMALAEQKRFRDVFRMKWSNLRSANPDIPIPPFDENEDLTLVHMRFDYWAQVSYNACKAGQMRDYAMYAWAFMQFIYVQMLGIEKMNGYIDYQLGNMRLFEPVLIKMGEQKSEGSVDAMLSSDTGIMSMLEGYSPFVQFLIMSLGSSLFFLLVSYGVSKIYSNPEKATKLQEQFFSWVHKDAENTRNRLGDRANLIADVINNMRNGGSVMQAVTAAMLGGGRRRGAPPNPGLAAPPPAPMQAEVPIAPAYVEE
jgi:hypothetical protein